MNKTNSHKIKTTKNEEAIEQIKKNIEYLTTIIEWKQYQYTIHKPIIRATIKRIKHWLDQIQPNYEVIIT